MEFLLDPGIWVGLLTLIILEIVLGIDNLVFIAILAEKLPPEQRDKARVVGLSLALFMRLGLLFAISWLVTLTKPLITLFDWTFSGRDLILLFGGLFLVYKAVTELHEKMEGKPEIKVTTNVVYAGFTAVVAQIVVLDAVFSLDSVITAIGMVDNIYVMMVAMIVAMAVMLLASKPLTNFVNRHPTVVILCLSFLLLIGISLMAEGFGFHIPKGYIYSGIGVAIVIEAFNQFTQRNMVKQESKILSKESITLPKISSNPIKEVGKNNVSVSDIALFLGGATAVVAAIILFLKTKDESLITQKLPVKLKEVTPSHMEKEISLITQQLQANIWL